jgi:uncharacterized iron-regulated protein
MNGWGGSSAPGWKTGAPETVSESLLRLPVTLFVVTLLLPSLVACQNRQNPGGHPHHSPHQPIAEARGGAGGSSSDGVIDLRNTRGLDSILPDLTNSRIIYVGEAHDDYAHHLKQLEIIRKLYALHPNMAIGMEQFQAPYQPVLDDFIAGRLSEKEMLRKTEWYRRWRFDYRLYRPILTFARDRGIPVVALNVPKEITDRVARQGMEGLTQEQRAAVPQEIDRSDQTYHARLMQVFSAHPHAGEQQFERFLQVQLLWDEGMAQRVAGHLQQHPDRKMVVLAGSGHLEYGSGIPNRVARRLTVPYTILLPADGVPAEPTVADILLITGEEKLADAGVMGVLLEDSEEGVVVREVMSDSGAHSAGLKKDDLITRIEGVAVRSTAEVKIEMLDRTPGDSIRVTAQRRKWLLLREQLELELLLGN